MRCVMGLCWKPYELDYVSRLLSIETEDESVKLTFDASLDADGVKCSLEEATIEAAAPGERCDLPVKFWAPDLDWSIRLDRSDDGRRLLISSEIHNPTQEPIRLNECRLVSVIPGRGAVTLEGHCGDAVQLDESLRIVSSAGRALHLSFVPPTRQHAFHRFDCGPEGFTLLQSVCDFQGYMLPPGESIATETLAIEMSDEGGGH